MKLSQKLKAAMRGYYQGRKEGNDMIAAGGESKWNKEEALEKIIEALPKSVTNFQATAGTFWITWKQPDEENIQTVHSERNYWTMKVLARWNKRKKDWVKSTDSWS